MKSNLDDNNSKKKKKNQCGERFKLSAYIRAGSGRDNYLLPSRLIGVNGAYIYIYRIHCRKKIQIKMFLQFSNKITTITIIIIDLFEVVVDEEDEIRNRLNNTLSPVCADVTRTQCGFSGVECLTID